MAERSEAKSVKFPKTTRSFASHFKLRFAFLASLQSFSFTGTFPERVIWDITCPQKVTNLVSNKWSLLIIGMSEAQKGKNSKKNLHESSCSGMNLLTKEASQYKRRVELNRHVSGTGDA